MLAVPDISAIKANHSGKLSARPNEMSKICWVEEIVQATTQLRQLLLTRGIRRLTAGGPEEG